MHLRGLLIAALALCAGSHVACGQGVGITIKVHSSESGAVSATFTVAMFEPGPAQEKYEECLLSGKKMKECHQPFTTAIDYAVGNNGRAVFGYLVPDKSYLVVASNNNTGAWRAIRVSGRANKPVSVSVGVPEGGPVFRDGPF